MDWHVFLTNFLFLQFFLYFVCFPQIYTYFKKIIFCQKTLFFTTKNFWQNFVEKRGKIGEILQKFIF